MIRHSATIGITAAILAIATQVNQAATVNVVFERDGRLQPVERLVPDGLTEFEAAVYALVTGPTAEEIQEGYTSNIATSVTVVSLNATEDTVTVDLSPEILTGLDEAALLAIFDQFRTTLGDFAWISAIRLTCDNALLASYLEPVVFDTWPAAPDRLAIEPAPMGLGGRNITIGPSHGRFWNGSGWYWQRSDPCGFGEAVLEDTNSIRLMQFLYQYLVQDGATVHVPRTLTESTCCQSDTGLHWWKMAAYSWLRQAGLPCSVYASSSGICSSDMGGVSRSSDDIRARPLFADYRGSHIYIAHHTNAAGGTGTETFRDTAMEHPAHEANSYTLALAANNNIVNAIRDMYDAGWANRGVKDSAGGFGEIRIPDRPAILIELAFHDRCDKDALYLVDNFFRSVSQWGLYKGICEYFGTSPTWDKYSCEYVSDTIPSTMETGVSYPVSVTFRNRGVLWSNARSFRLGAAGDSDPFTAFNRVNISGEVRPGNTYTFNFTMVAPASAGTYTTDWRMVRDGVAWFGPTHSEQVVVSAAGPYDDAELISEDIPASLIPGQSTTVHLTFRNNGTTDWTYADNYKLGAVGDSDPFAATRHTLPVGDTVPPGQQRTFAFTFTAPVTVNTYTTDWRMIHEPSGWFGATLSKQVAVAYPPVTALFDDFEAYANQAAFEAVWIDTGNSEYYLNTSFGNGGKSVQMPSPSANYLGRYYRNLGASYNPSDAEPLVFSFDFYLDAAGAPNWSGARHFCDLRGYSGGSYGNGTLQNLLAIGLYNNSGDTWSTTKYQGRVVNGVEWITLDEGSAPNRMSGWHQLKIEVTTSQVRFYVDNILSETEARPNAYGFDSVVIGADLTASGYTAYVDNMNLTWYAATPVIDSHPVAQSVCEGDMAQFGVSAYGGSISYRWQKNNVDLNDGGHYSGVFTDTLTVSNADAADAADYRCVVSNGIGNATSNNAVLSLKAATLITTQPQSQQVARGGTATFTVAGTGAGTLAYQWQKNGDDMPGEQLDTLEITGCGNSDVASYRCIVTGDCGSVVSDEAALTLPPPGDFDLDNDVDLTDFNTFQGCFNGPNRPLPYAGCVVCDFDEDDDVDLSDFQSFQGCFNGPNRPPACQ